MANLTRKQQQIYDYILSFTMEHGYPPSVREIGSAMGLKSPSTVHFHIKHLEELGYLSKDGRKGRALTLVERPDAAPVAQQISPVQEAAYAPGRVPVLGDVAAGTPILAQECIDDYIPFDTQGRDGEFFALRVRGESMLNAGILPGDLVVVHRQSEAQSGQIVVALFEDEATVKTLRRRDGKVWLMPANDEYQPIDGTKAQILGQVVAVVRRY